MTAWRSSRDLPVTRSSSPWICVLMPLGPSSRMILATFLAVSLLRPSLMSASRRYSLPDGFGSGPSSPPVSRDFSEIPRRISLVWNTSRTASTRSDELAIMRIFSPLHAIDAPTPLKSYRWAISFEAWLRALSTSWWSTLLTTSNEASLAMALLLLPALTRGWSRGRRCVPAFREHCPGVAILPPARCTRVRPSGVLSVGGHTLGGLPEWPKGADCKSAGNAYGGSNPSPATTGRPSSSEDGRSSLNHSKG